MVLIRDGAAAPEAFTLTRASTMAFSAGATVFPGGGVDDADTLEDSFFTDVDLTGWARAFGDGEETVRRLLVAAVRETFEECGVLLTRAEHGGFADPRAFEAHRCALEAHELSMSSFLTDSGLRPDFSLLRPLARWVTPEDQPRRYDTRFFLAPLPQNQEAAHTTGEAVAADWMSPHQAFELFRNGRTDLMPPTWSQFRELGRFASAAAAMAPGVGQPVTQVRPVTVPGSQPRKVRFPHDADYYADSPAHRGLTPGS